MARAGPGRAGGLGAGSDRGPAAGGASPGCRGASPRRRPAGRAPPRGAGRGAGAGGRGPAAGAAVGAARAGPVPGRPAGRGAAHPAPGPHACSSDRARRGSRARTSSPSSRPSCARTRRWSRPTALPEPSAACPYLGLVAYDVADAEAFFGRDAEVAACLGRLADASACSPSSDRRAAASRRWSAPAWPPRSRRDGRRVVVVTPGAHPMDALTALPASGPDAGAGRRPVRGGGHPLHDPAERAGFFAALADHAERAPLVVALRADRMGDVSAHPDFARLVERGLHLLTPMSETICGPRSRDRPARPGCCSNPGWSTCWSARSRANRAPCRCCRTRCAQTWERREGRTLTVAGLPGHRRYPRRGRPVGRGHLRTGPGRAAAACSATCCCAWCRPRADGEPVPSRVPRRTIATDTDHEHLIELLVARSPPDQRRRCRRARPRGPGPGMAPPARLARRRRRRPTHLPPPGRHRRRVGRHGPAGHRAVPRRPPDPGARVAGPTPTPT